MQLRKNTDIKLIQQTMNYKVNKDHSFIKKGGGEGRKALPDYSKGGYGVPKKGKTTLPDYSVGKGKHDHPHDRINGKPGSGLEPDKVAKDETKKKVKSTTKSNPDGSYSITKSDGKTSATSTYKKESKDSNVYVNENDQKRTFTTVSNETKDDPAMNINRASRKGS